jgi:Xaa-Pro aminopeptidase
MKNHIDEEMKQRNLDWIILGGPRHSNPDMTYFLGEVNILHPMLIKKCGDPMIVIHNSLERGEVERLPYEGVDVEEILPRGETRNLRSPFERDLLFFDRLISRFGIGGKCAFYGLDDIHKYFFIQREIEKKYRSITLVCDLEYPIFQCLRITKDESEIATIRDVTRRTILVFEALFSYLRSLKIENGQLVDIDGRRPLLGDLRRLVYTTMACNGLVASEIPIISTGRDAAIPHSVGDNSAYIETGKTIVLDIFPRCLSTSYLTDITRTVCIGEASPRVKEVYAHVLEAQELARKNIAVGTALSHTDGVVSTFFEQKGYETLQSHAGTQRGYIHSLGHGVGLELHEKPRISVFNNERDSGTFMPGMVFTIEPGLYFPDEEMGVRIEDIAVLRQDNRLEILSDFPRELEIIPEG